MDLYRAVRQGIRASVESYSIKKLEPLYEFERTVDLRDAGSSIVEFETWLELVEGRRRCRRSSTRIAGYNRDDCVSTWQLRDWLEARRPSSRQRLGQALPRPEYRDEVSRRRPSREKLAACRRRQRRSRRDCPRHRLERPRGPTGALAARAAPRLASARGETGVVALLTSSSTVGPTRIESRSRSRSRRLTHDGSRRRGEANPWIDRYAFPPQDTTSGRPDASSTRPPKELGEDVDVDNGTGTVDLKRGDSRRHRRAPNPTSIVPDWRSTTEAMEASCSGSARCAERGLEGGRPLRAARDLCSAPSARGGPGGAETLLARSGERSTTSAARTPDVAASWRPCWTRPRDPGPAGLRQVHDGRRDDRGPRRSGQAGRGHRATATR